MSDSVSDNGNVDPQKVARTNPNVEIEKVREARDLVRILRSYGISSRKYSLAPPFQRQMYGDIQQWKEDTET